MDYRKGIIPVLIIALVITGAWGYTQYQTKIDYKLKLTGQYQRYFYDMKDNIETVQTSLEKALLSESKEKNILLFTQIWQQAYFAQDKISQLPIRHSDLAKTEKFLNQVADYSFAMIQNHLDGRKPDSKQRQALFKLQDYTQFLAKELDDTHQKIMKGNIDLNRIRRKEDDELKEADEDMLDTGLAKYEEEQLTEYPELIYDGPFSDQVISIKPRGLGKGTVDENKASDIATGFIKNKRVKKITSFKQGEDSNTATIESYTFSIDTEENGTPTYIGISKTGGKVVWMEHPRSVDNEELSKEQALKAAQKFLSEKGYKNMEPNYSQQYNNIILYNFAYKQDDITIYSDLIKVKVAQDNGEIVSFDAANYLKSHYERDIPKPELSQEEAREKLRYDFDIENVRLAIIPDRGKRDLLCYEFKGKYKGTDFIVYINALNGKEEEILKIILDEDGILMM